MGECEENVQWFNWTQFYVDILNFCNEWKIWICIKNCHVCKWIGMNLSLNLSLKLKLIPCIVYKQCWIVKWLGLVVSTGKILWSSYFNAWQLICQLWNFIMNFLRAIVIGVPTLITGSPNIYSLLLYKWFVNMFNIFSGIINE